MADYLDHSERWRTRQQPRRVDYSRPGFERPADPCDECSGTGLTVQGWTDKNGEPEDQYGPCRECGGGPDAA